MSLSLIQKSIISFLLLFSAIFATYGGFSSNHIDSEYHKSLYNKSYFLHYIYGYTSKLEFAIKKTILKDPKALQSKNVKEFKKSNQKHGWSLYLVNSLFAMLGVFAVFRLNFLLSNSFWLSILASIVLMSSYFWNAEAHYPTTDMPLSSLVIFLFSELFAKSQSHNKANFDDKIFEGMLLGACFAVKYIGLITLIPYIYFKLRTKKLKESIISIFFALSLLALSIGDKFPLLLKHSLKEFKVQTSEGWAGYNSNDAGLIYHIKESLYSEYGLALSVLALFGFIYLFINYKDNKEKNLFIITITIFITLLLVMISSTVIKTVRFALPLIPFLAIFSSFGVCAVHKLLSKLDKGFATKLTSLIIILSLYPALAFSIKHNKLMAGNDTIEYQAVLKSQVNAIGAKFEVFPRVKFFDRIPDLQDAEYMNRCTKEAIDFKEELGFNKESKLVISLNSFKLDRFIFDNHYKCTNSHLAFTNFSELKLLEITPFNKEKQEVPFSFISNFSPRKPDLNHRKKQRCLF